MPPKHVPRKQGLFHLKEEKPDDLTDKITTIKPKLNINQWKPKLVQNTVNPKLNPHESETSSGALTFNSLRLLPYPFLHPYSRVTPLRFDIG